MISALPDPESASSGCYADSWWDSGFRELVSITPSDAVISPHSTLKEKSRGKAPGLPTPEGWVGYDWLRRFPSRDNVAKWRDSGAGLGLQTGKYPAVDIDVVDEQLARAIEAMALDMLGAAPCRIGRAPKRLLLYVTDMPMAKRRVEWTVAGEDKPQAVELLGQGQQCVIEGIHPTTGRPYSWGDWHPVLLGVGGLTHVTEVQVVAFLAAVQDYLTLKGYDTRESCEEVSQRQNVAQEQLAGEIEEVEAAVRAIPNTVASHPTREDYIRMGVAIKAALPAWPDEAFDIWAEWGLRYEGGTNTVEMMDSDWSRMHPPYSIGAQWLFDLAARHGDTSRIESRFDFEASSPDIATRNSTDAVKPDTQRIHLLRDLMENPGLLAPPAPVVERLAYEGRITLLSAPRKSGKSTLMGAAAAALTRGARFLESEVEPGMVLWCCLDEPMGDLVRRLVAYGADPDRVYVLDPCSTTELIAYARHVSASASGCDLLVVIDAIGDLHAREVESENDSSQVRRALTPLRDFVRQSGVALLAAHHTNKATGRARGAGAYEEVADVVLTLSIPKDDPGVRHIRAEGRTGVEDFQFRLGTDGVELADGAPTTLQLLEHVIALNPGCSTRTAQEKVGRRAEEVRAAIGKLRLNGRIENRGTDSKHAWYVSTVGRTTGHAP